MSYKKINKVKNEIINNDDKDRKKYGKWAYYILLGLIVEIVFCLIFGWLCSDGEFNTISDNYVTSLLQNYNFILGTAVLLPVIAYIYARLRKELIAKFVSDNQIMMYGFICIILALIAIISVCICTYQINSTTWYGRNSAGTVGVFLSAVVIFLFLSIIYGILKLPDILKNRSELWKFVKRYSPIILMVMFLIWTFVSCMLAPNAADDVIGAEAAAKAGASPSDVLSKTLNGCYNLKDGYWAFLMYGSIMLGAMLIGKDRIKEKKKLIVGYIIVMTALSIITLGITVYYNYQLKVYREGYNNYLATSGENETNEYNLTWKDFENILKNKTYNTSKKMYIFEQRSIFRNSNHFAYVLCMAVTASAVLAVIDKKLINKLLYLLAFTILTCMLIVNDTFGGYLGVLIALIALLIYAIICTFSKQSDDMKIDGNKQKIYSLITLIVIFLIFTVLSLNIKGADGEINAVRNIKNFAKDVGIFGGYMITEENATEVDITELDDSIRYAGSHRGETWIKVWELVKQRPMFGYGLECLLFQFSGQFGINEGRTHNLLLQLLGTVGIPGTIMYFTALGIVLVRLLKNWKTWDDIEKITTFVGIAYIITALTGNSTYYTSPYFMMFLGFVVLTPWKREIK